MRRIEPAAVILDVRLPRLDGWDVLARLKADPATAALPVVIVSMIDERGRGFALGAAEYLVKPVDRERCSPRSSATSPPAQAPPSSSIDDDPMDLDLVEAVLAPAGYSVLRARRRRGGRGPGRPRAARRSSCSICSCPGSTASRSSSACAPIPATADVPIVVLTAKEMTGEDRERLAGQINYLAQKGAFGGQALVALVGHLCESGRPAEAAR